MKRIVFFSGVVLVASVLMGLKPFWGAIGHRAVGEIAQENLSKKAQKQVYELLDGHSLAFVSTYADEIKSDDKYDKYYTWHYVNFDGSEKYDPAKANPKGDLISGIAKCKSVLMDQNASKQEKQFHLKMLVHLIGDMHQPLHVGHGYDKGGNDIKVKWFYKNANLHSVWDSKMIQSYEMSYTELAENRDVLSAAQKAEIQKGDVMDWMYESKGLAEEVYASCKQGDNLSYEYMYIYFPMVRDQLQKGGLRLAKVLNEIYE